MIWPIKRRTTLSIPRTLILIAIAIGIPVGVAVADHVPGAPGNDDYLDSFALNDPRDRLERTATLKDTQNTANASVQSDVFTHPGEPAGGGPPEPVTCEGSSYGKTIWYDFYPDVPGVVRIRANGYDAVISVVPFRRATGEPQFGRRACINDSSSTQEELLMRGARGPRLHDPAGRRERRRRVSSSSCSTSWPTPTTTACSTTPTTARGCTAAAGGPAARSDCGPTSCCGRSRPPTGSGCSASR